jgi:hypothetical protein
MSQCHCMSFKSAYLGIPLQIQVGLIRFQENSLPCTSINSGFLVVSQIQSTVHSDAIAVINLCYY